MLPNLGAICQPGAASTSQQISPSAGETHRQRSGGGGGGVAGMDVHAGVLTSCELGVYSRCCSFGLAQLSAFTGMMAVTPNQDRYADTICGNETANLGCSNAKNDLF